MFVCARVDDMPIKTVHFKELALFSKFANPRFFWCYEFEDFSFDCPAPAPYISTYIKMYAITIDAKSRTSPGR